MRKFAYVILSLFIIILLSCSKEDKSSTSEIKDTETKSSTLTVKDIEGNVYQTVQIGEQIWMAENLKVTHYNNGNPIPDIDDEWDDAFGTDGYYAAYNDNVANVDIYGYLYNWHAVSTGMLAPEGWHVATFEEWKELQKHLTWVWEEGNPSPTIIKNGGSKLAGRADLWEDGELENNQEFGTSGFNALPGGAFDSSGYRGNHLGALGRFWTSTEDLNWEMAHSCKLYSNRPIIEFDYMSRRYKGFSIRCIKDKD